MRQLLIAGAMALMPSLGCAATVGQWWDRTYWFLGPEAEVPLVTDGGRTVTHNTGYLRVALTEGGLAGRTFTEGYMIPPVPLGLEQRFTVADNLVFESGGVESYSVTFDANEDLVDWSFAHIPWRAEYGSAYLGHTSGDRALFYRYMEDADVLFQAGPGMWYRSEAAYVQAARSAGVAPIPLPGVAWMILGGLAAISGLRLRCGMA